MESKIFRQSSIDRISSPEELNDYLKVARPSTWVLLAGVLLLLAAFLVFGLYGELPTTITATCLAKGGDIICYVTDVARLDPGMPARAGGHTGSVLSVSSVPLSREEIDEIHPEDYVVFQLDPQAWNYPVRLSIPGLPDGLWDVVITAETIRPVEFLLEGRQGR